MTRTLNVSLILLISFIVINCSNDDKDSVSDNNMNVGMLDKVKTNGGSNNDSAQAIKATQDGGYIVLGYTLSNDQDITDKEGEDADFYLLKYDGLNELQWSKTYGGTGDDRGYDIIENQDGSLVILGYSTSNDGDATSNEGDKDYWVLKLSSTGVIIWQKSFGYSGEDFGTSLIKSSEGGYVLVGELDVVGSNGEGDTTKTTNNRHAGGNYWAIKITEDGKLEWSKQFGGGFSETPKDIVQTDDGGYIIVGESDSDDLDITNNKGFYDFWVIKISNTGILEWQKSFGGSNIDNGFSITKANDGNYLIVGATKSSDIDVSANKGVTDIWLVKISPSGDLISEKTIGGSNFDTAEKIINTTDGGYLIAGSSRSEDGDVSENQGQIDGWIIKLDTNQDIVWQISTGGSQFDYIYDVAELSNGSIIAVGDTFSNDGTITENKGLSDILTITIKQSSENQ
ncbi:hypothetical protein [uncultured Aquimarina sp.]|uniref:hypothetical protein n=1 Tax=uncultured Aquimarina sp. TaxID=575652 RepID=UPI0026260C4D|nr:hypothetical protein [uncultured Aquimarina sp.]